MMHLSGPVQNISQIMSLTEILFGFTTRIRNLTHQLHLQIIRLSDNVVVVDEWFTTPEEFPVSYEYQIPDEHVNTNYKINMNCYGSPTYKNTWQVWVGTDEITALPDTIPDAVKSGMWFILILFVAGLFTYVTGPQGAVVVSLMTGF